MLRCTGNGGESILPDYFLAASDPSDVSGISRITVHVCVLATVLIIFVVSILVLIIIKSGHLCRDHTKNAHIFDYLVAWQRWSLASRIVPLHSVYPFCHARPRRSAVRMIRRPCCGDNSISLRSLSSMCFFGRRKQVFPDIIHTCLFCFDVQVLQSVSVMEPGQACFMSLLRLSFTNL